MDIYTKIRIRNRLTAIAPAIFEWREERKLLGEIRGWQKRGLQHPLPHLLKRSILKTETFRIGATCLIETGTYTGDTPWFFRRDIPCIYTIEIDPKLAALARARFSPQASHRRGNDQITRW